ncbi:Preprotein translocase subunit SecB [Sphingobacterium multivorum]|nr:protein-export chaperone SecB [Sphingobacterium multivorum]SUI98457.1 Preprotein translocase subunit SecB [Sphingobacterium multivorum]
MEQASFKISNYRFTKTILDFSYHNGEELEISFVVSGQFIKSQSKYDLNFTFNGSSKGFEEPFVTVDCIATFQFTNVSSLSEVPNYFFRNSIALLFPYVRAYISMITLQSNTRPIVLPTLNLSALEEPLKNNSTEID